MEEKPCSSEAVQEETYTLSLYPNGRGHYAYAHPQGLPVKVGSQLTVRLDGKLLTGTVSTEELGDYLQFQGGGRCGLCPAMQVVVSLLEAQEIYKRMASSTIRELGEGR
jgi:hypothetical protein